MFGLCCVGVSAVCVWGGGGGGVGGGGGGGVYLTRVTAGQVQHVEEEPELTGQAELLLAEVVLHQAADGLQEVQHLACPRGSRQQTQR